MTVVAALLFVALIGLVLALAGVGIFYALVLRPRFAAAVEAANAAAVDDKETLAQIIEQLNALARLRDQGILTAREFSTKKSEMLERI
jgi:cytochrome c-type biogenesis protein CcmH/NrfG